MREREVLGRIRVTDREIDALVDQQRAAAGASTEYNIAQVLVTVPDGASETVVAERRARAEEALRRVQAGEPFAQVAREMSEDGNRAKGGEIGMRPAEKLPDVFVEVVRPLAVGAVAPDTAAQWRRLSRHQARRSTRCRGIDDHRRRARVTSCCVRRPQVSQQAALRRLAELKRQIVAGTPHVRAGGARQLRGLERRAGRRPRLGLAGDVRSRVRAGDEPAAASVPSPTRSCRASARTCSR